MINELIFLMQVTTIATCALISLYLGAEALVTFVCLSGIMANFFVLKQTTLFGLNATTSDAFAIAATFGLNLLQEYFGKPIARKTIWLSFVFALFYLIMGNLHLAFTPALFDTKHAAYAALLTFMPRIVAASFITFVLSQTLDYFLYGFLRKIWQQRFIMIRNVTSLLASQLFDTVLFTFLGLYGIVGQVWHIILVSYSIKVVVILLIGPFIGLAKRISGDQQPQ